MAKNGSQQAENLNEEVRNRLDWMDEERRKTARKLAELEQQITTQARQIDTRDQRIQSLEEKLAKTTSQLSHLSQVDNRLQQFKDELVRLIEQYDQRRIKNQDEQDKLRRVEHEVHNRELASIRKEIAAISRIENNLDLREAEEIRLSKLIGSQQNRISVLEQQVESWQRSLEFLQEAERSKAREVTELQTQILETSKRWEPIEGRLDRTNHGLAKAEANIQELTGIAGELRQSVQSWTEQIQVGEYERNQRLESWKDLLDQQQDDMDRFAKEWIKFSDQYKEAKMAVQSMAEWQKQMEQAQREASELARVEGGRMRAAWDKFTLETEKHRKTFEVDQEQRWAGADRRERQLREALNEIGERLDKLEREKETLWRVQNAQADVMKKLGRIWLEEVDQAINQNPHSRRQPTLVPMPEE